MIRSLLLCAALVSHAVQAAAEDAGAERGWYVSGPGAPGYEVAPLPVAPCGGSGARLRALGAAAPTGPVAMLQTIDGQAARGRRVRFSAVLSARGVTGWAGLLLRVDGAGLAVPVGDDQRGSPVRGTLACGRRAVVVQVPPEAVSLTVGAVLEGPGELEVSGVALEQVGADVPLTAGPQAWEGRVGGVAFNDLALQGVDGAGLPVNVLRGSPGRWQDQASETSAELDGEEVEVRSLERVDRRAGGRLGTQPLPLDLEGRFTVRRAGAATLVEGEWGTTLGRHRVRIVLTPSQLDMQWGLLERHLRVERDPAPGSVPAGCRAYAAGPEARAERLVLCGAVLGPTPPPVQTVLGFLLAGFRRQG